MQISKIRRYLAGGLGVIYGLAGGFFLYAIPAGINFSQGMDLHFFDLVVMIAFPFILGMTGLITGYHVTIRYNEFGLRNLAALLGFTAGGVLLPFLSVLHAARKITNGKVLNAPDWLALGEMAGAIIVGIAVYRIFLYYYLPDVRKTLLLPPPENSSRSTV